MDSDPLLSVIWGLPIRDMATSNLFPSGHFLEGYFWAGCPWI